MEIDKYFATTWFHENESFWNFRHSQMDTPERLFASVRASVSCFSVNVWDTEMLTFPRDGIKCHDEFQRVSNLNLAVEKHQQRIPALGSWETPASFS